MRQHDLGIASDTIRRRNLISRGRLRTKLQPGKVYDPAISQARSLVPRELLGGFNKRAAQSRRTGRLRGIGIVTYIEACGNNGPETATLNLDPTAG
jgi:carbon-monoxide dehydrogenase large subunit